ncbi:MAG TPA: energy transducer TonB [Saprospiraceae bacterium]|nr:energy transducer TonB [Saprospiraceae bacterium]
MNLYSSILIFVMSIITTVSAHGQNPVASLSDSEKISTKVRSAFLEDDADILYQRRIDYSGGQEAIQHVVAEHLVYPALAREYNREGTVILRILVNSRGKVVENKVMQSVGLGCDEEARRVVSLLSDWIPAQQGTNLISGYFYLPVHFSLK